MCNLGKCAVSLACLCAVGAASLPVSGAPVTLQNATAFYFMESDDVLNLTGTIVNVLDGSDSTYWDAFSRYTVPDAGHAVKVTAVFETVDDLVLGENENLTLQLFQRAPWAKHLVGKFRLSATTADRDQFADGGQTAGDIGLDAIWTPLTPDTITSVAGCALQLQPDNSILNTTAGESLPAVDDYLVTAQTSLAGITGFRLEMLYDPSLPVGGHHDPANGGPGKVPNNGNFVVTQFRVDTGFVVPPPAPVTLQNATSSYFGVGGLNLTGSAEDTLPGRDNVGWDAYAKVDNVAHAVPTTGVFETMEDVGTAGGTQLIFTIAQNSPWADHLVGRFRLSATTADRDQFADGKSGNPKDGVPGKGEDGNLGDDSIWTILTPETATADFSVLAIQPDGSILNTDWSAADTDVFTITCTTSLAGITGFRLEMLNDPSLPGPAEWGGGPGTAGQGNFVLTNFAVHAVAIPEPGTLPLLLLGMATAWVVWRGRRR